MQLPFLRHTKRPGCCTTLSILMFCDWGGFEGTFSHINIDGVAIRWSWGPFLRIYKRNAGRGVSLCERGQYRFWSAPQWCTFCCCPEQFSWERDDSNPRLMRSEQKGVVQRQIQFPCNALLEMIVVICEGAGGWGGRFHFRGSGNAKWGPVDSGNEGIAFGTSSQTVHCWATHTQRLIQFIPTLVLEMHRSIYQVSGGCASWCFWSGSFKHKSWKSGEKKQKMNETQNQLWLLLLLIKHLLSRHWWLRFSACHDL